MDAFANGRRNNVAAVFGTALILGLNAVLLLQAFGVEAPGPPGGLGLRQRHCERRPDERCAFALRSNPAIVTFTEFRSRAREE